MQQGNWRRRDVVQLATVGALALAGAGCAQTSGRKAAARVVVVGGGWGGLGAVRSLLAEGDGRLDVTLVEPNAGFMSCPLSAHYIAGWQPASDFQFDYQKIDALGVRRVAQRVTAIDRERRQVVAGNERIGYDFLVLAPGIEYMEDALPGYAEARERLPIGFRAFEQEAVKREVDAFLAEGGDFVITVPSPPYRCPPAPYERACLIAEQMRRRNVKGRIIVLDANAAPTPAPIAKPVLEAMRREYPTQIDYRSNVKLQGIDAGRRRLQTSEGELAFARINVVLPMQAPALLRQAGLAQRWAGVQLPSFQSTADDRIYIIGDAQGSPLPKSGHVAFHAGKQVGEAIAQRVAGKAPAAPTGPVDLPTGICWAAVTHDKAININVSATVAPGAPAQLKFSVDPEHNARSGAAAMAWGKGMWRAMLG